LRFLLRLLRPPRTTELPPVAWCLPVESNSPWRQQTFPKQQLLLRRRLPSPQFSSSSSSSSSSYKDEKQRPLDPFSPPTQGNSSNSSSSAPTLAEPNKPLAQNAFKTLPNFIFLGSSSSYGALHFPRSLCRARFAARIHKSVAGNEGFTILALQTLLPRVVMLLLLLQCARLANHVLLLQIGFSQIQAAMKDDEQEVPRLCSQGSLVHCKRTTKN
jgi:hypothetical protein